MKKDREEKASVRMPFDMWELRIGRLGVREILLCFDTIRGTTSSVIYEIVCQYFSQTIEPPTLVVRGLPLEIPPNGSHLIISLSTIPTVL